MVLPLCYHCIFLLCKVISCLFFLYFCFLEVKKMTPLQFRVCTVQTTLILCKIIVIFSRTILRRIVLIAIQLDCFFRISVAEQKTTNAERQWWCLRAQNDYLNLHLLYLHCVRFLLLICNKRCAPLPSLHLALAVAADVPYTLRANMKCCNISFCSFCLRIPIPTMQTIIKFMTL